MSLAVKQKFSYYKRFELDIWGSYYTSESILGFFKPKSYWTLSKNYKNNDLGNILCERKYKFFRFYYIQRYGWIPLNWTRKTVIASYVYDRIDRTFVDRAPIIYFNKYYKSTKAFPYFLNFNKRTGHLLRDPNLIWVPWKPKSTKGYHPVLLSLFKTFPWLKSNFVGSRPWFPSLLMSREFYALFNDKNEFIKYRTWLNRWKSVMVGYLRTIFSKNEWNDIISKGLFIRTLRWRFKEKSWENFYYYYLYIKQLRHLRLPRKVKGRLHWWEDWRFRFFYKIFLDWNIYEYRGMRRFIYRVDIPDTYTTKRKIKKVFSSYRLTCLYFITFKDFQYRHLFKLASKMDGNLEEHLYKFLECRLLALVYRMHFWFDIFGCISIIQQKLIAVNGVIESQLNKCLNIGDFIFFYYLNRRFRYFLLIQSKWRGGQNAYYFNIPSFLFVSLRLCFGILLKPPVKSNLVYPIGVDIQKVTGYYT